jgi:hypothetical protein
MIAASTGNWSDVLWNPIQLGVIAYLFVGLIVAGVIAVPGMKLRRPPNNGMLWERKTMLETYFSFFRASSFFLQSLFLESSKLKGHARSGRTLIKQVLRKSRALIALMNVQLFEPDFPFLVDDSLLSQSSK